MDADSASEPGAIIPAQFRRALTSLISAFDYAEDSRIDRWQFAVEMEELLSSGASRVDIRWLILRGFAEHGRETTLPGEAERSFRPLVATSFPSDTCLVLSPHGAQTLRNVLRNGQQHTSCPADSASPVAIVAAAPPQLQPTPEWDELRRELRYQGTVIKRYRVPAPNQEAILASFQQLAWPDFIDNPLSQADAQDPKQRLHVTIKSLNRNRLHPLIKFHGNGNGRQIHWVPVESR